MKTAKPKVFSDATIELAQIAKALGHPARIEILRLLIERQSCVCGTIVDALPLSQATVSQHLRALKDAGLIKGTIEGPRVCYCIDERTWAQAQEVFVGLFTMQACADACDC